jgi:thymidine phosphorylase
MKQQNISKLRMKRIGIDTLYEHVIFMRQDCHLCKSEGYEALTRLRVTFNGITIIATLNVLRDGILEQEEISLSESGIEALQAKDGDFLEISHLSPIDSLGLVRAKIYGRELSYANYNRIISDIVSGYYSTIDITGFVTACASREMKAAEITSLTRAMIDAGDKITWDFPSVMDKHCIGGIPANRTTPIVISIAAAYGLIIPKTSSKAITSPAGTADVMQVLTNVNLDIAQIKQVVNKEGACLCWGGSVRLSPADDILIRIERSLDIDSEGQMIASVLSKKKAAGSTHVLIDIPFGATAKVRSKEDADHIKDLFEKVGISIGLKVKVMLTDGEQPVGIGIGPELEARDVLAVLKNDPDAPTDLRERSLQLAAALLELSGKTTAQESFITATGILESGKAFEKFKAICTAQGRYSEPGDLAPFKQDILSTRTGIVTNIDNRKLAKIAKLAGAPNDAMAGIRFYAHLNTQIDKNQPLYTVFADSPGQLNYALEYVKNQSNIIKIQQYGEGLD